MRLGRIPKKRVIINFGRRKINLFCRVYFRSKFILSLYFRSKFILR